ncbi:tetratricopeptide repeat protein [Aquimarina sp. SS2-1]|uniref:tetratricopeptide repeat protein n=1 Tax=Aquimarina besae TaxID=3342247 RepID=UPI00367268FC
MKKTLFIFLLLISFGCKKVSETDRVVKNGIIYYKDTTDLIIRDYEENESLILEAIELTNNNEPNKAILKFNQAEKKYGDRLSIFINRGFCFDMIGERKKAIDDFTKCLEIKDDYFVALQNRGLSYMHSKQYDKSLIDFNKAIEVNPSESAGYLNRALLHARMKKIDKCCSDAKKSIELGFVEKYNNEMPQNLLGKYCK